jgi:hypothetical protein
MSGMGSSTQSTHPRGAPSGGEGGLSTLVLGFVVGDVERERLIGKLDRIDEFGLLVWGQRGDVE